MAISILVAIKINQMLAIDEFLPFSTTHKYSFSTGQTSIGTSLGNHSDKLGYSRQRTSLFPPLSNQAFVRIQISFALKNRVNFRAWPDAELARSPALANWHRHY
jgi:hypothetical protein